MKKEELKPVDLGNLEDKCIAIVDALDKSEDYDRSEEYRIFHLKKAKQIARTLQHDFRHYMDKYKIGGIVPYGLDQIEVNNLEKLQ